MTSEGNALLPDLIIKHEEDWTNLESQGRGAKYGKNRRCSDERP
jgi:hypothetical protein